MGFVDGESECSLCHLYAGAGASAEQVGEVAHCLGGDRTGEWVFLEAGECCCDGGG